MYNMPLNRLIELAKLFLKLGVTGFGGPVAHIAMIEYEVVKRRQWLTQEHFLDLLGATNLIPGPNSTEMAIHIGYIYAGWLGLIVSGISFILPAVLITGVFAFIYVSYGSVPEFSPLLYGIKPVVLAIILNAVFGLSKKALKNKQLLIIAVLVALVTYFGKVNEVITLLLGGILGMIWLHNIAINSNKQTNLLITALTLGTTLPKVALTPTISIWQLGLFFLKVGSVLFGGGYLLIAFLQGELVDQYHWLTQQQLLDAIAIGQFTPGPILSTATFIGYIISGLPGAIVATVGIFLPSFLFVVLLNPVIPWLRKSPSTRSFLDAVNASAVALMIVTTLQIAVKTLGLERFPLLDLFSIFMFLIAAVLIIRFRINAQWLVLGGGLISIGLGLLGYL
ncbi:chromate transporter [Cylindrospermopsis raciborskii S07]|uniref:Chromate efflux transporter n=2 Tax=Cylindrospermopsis raciborskii TaxID=77022 RepID=A0A838WP37_9CYAN|nr:chromate efflux transporter [Cylindrospermopsis raciborskii]MBA4445782.1 chromate efflux transporter [Cylindrospermopsis raciborskii CS-506_C]MBA4450019.1 chromate efflux transporter [Cylindrospermopsis raciborskii CS-506_D]MBA4456630.1 chromate efflux transporter [Cylindrospermopsis raciborskii CS-506_B]MBA4465990.1 chromate efflux transporter [Cylindrospermopsis raciborskii CS-506_A]OHY34235.1 chromate transporter [Cylindrospermopsis raciborskii CS-508]